MAFTPDAIALLRKQLRLTQVQLAQLLGAHAVTVTRWEAGTLSPTPYQQAMLATFARVPDRYAAGVSAREALATDGVAWAVYVLLRAAFKESP